MDLRLFFSVLWRFRVVVAAGLGAAMILAVLSAYRVSFDGVSVRLEHRESELWISHEILLVSAQPPSGDTLAAAPDLGRLAQLANVYARLASADPVERLVREREPALYAGRIGAAPIEDDEGPVPIIDVYAQALTPEAAERLARATSAALRTYVAGVQEADRIAPSERVRMSVVKRAGDDGGFADEGATTLIRPRSRLRPIFIFTGVAALVVGLAFVLENLRPRARPVAAVGTAAEAPHSRTA